MVQVCRTKPGYYHHQEPGGLADVKAYLVLKQELMVYWTPKKPSLRKTHLEPGYDNWLRWSMVSHVDWRKAVGYDEVSYLNDNLKFWVLDKVTTTARREQAVCLSKLVEALELTRSGCGNRLSTNELLNRLTAMAQVVLVEYRPIDDVTESGPWAYKILERMGQHWPHPVTA